MSTRVWFAREAQFTADPKIQMLGHEFGPGGALVVEEIFALAKLAADNGTATVMYAQLAGRAFVTPSKAKQIINRAQQLGLIQFIDSPGPRGCSISLPRWSRWQVKDATAAERKQQQREREADQTSRECHAGDRDMERDVCVPVTPPTETETTTTAAARAGAHEALATITDKRVTETVEILKGCPRIQLDCELVGVANALNAHPNADHVKAAHRAIVIANAKGWTDIDSGRVMWMAFEDVARKPPAARSSGSSPPRQSAASAREERQNKRERVALRLAEQRGGETA